MAAAARGLIGLGLGLVIPLTTLVVPKSAEAVPTRPITGLAGSVALADEAQALLVNPAGLAFRDGWQGLFSKGWGGGRRWQPAGQRQRHRIRLRAGCAAHR